MSNQLKLVWLVDAQETFEISWIKTLLGSLSYTEIFDNELDTIYENALIVFNHGVNYEDYFAIYEEERTAFGAIHISDETLGDTCEFLSYDTCKFVFRNYHHPVHSFHPKVTTFGLGYKSGFEKIPQIFQQQPWYHWCFAGAMHNVERLNALKAFESHTPYLLIATGNEFNASGNVDLDHYRLMMDHSKFGLCPIGNCNLDTFRFYEVLEAGCIPVVIDNSKDQPYDKWNLISYWHALFKGENESFPWIHANSWDECSRIVSEILADPERYHHMRAKAKVFWEKWKNKWSLQLQSACVQELMSA